MIKRFSLSSFLLFLSLATGTAEIPGGLTLPPGLKGTLFSGPDITPCPASLASDPNGNVYVGVDLNGSLGKGPGKGRIVRLADTNQDGTADKHTIFAEVDNVRGLIPLGRKLIVLHTIIPKSTGKLEGMHLSVLTDTDGDGVADGSPKILVRDISVAKHNQNRGADHTTNGITLGIDGWIYVAVGDFGMVDATGTDGRKLTMLGGGVLRVRPDGSEMEVYTHRLRNIYDLAIDGLMNIYTRGNTNDGGGWNVRFIHHIQSADYGYPIYFKNFTDEILPALVDVGGGSGTGAMFMDEPTWPDPYNKVPMMCDWGRSQLIIHRITPDGPSFTQEAENFIKLTQITDAAVDGSGRLYLGAWDKAGFKGNPEKGFVVQVVPENWTYKPFPDLAKINPPELLKRLASESATARLYAQQVMVARNQDTAPVVELAKNPAASLEARVAAVFTIKQLLGEKATAPLVELARDATIREWALRALADRIPQNRDVPLQPFLEGLKDSNPRVQVAAAVGLGRLGKQEAVPHLLPLATHAPKRQREVEPPAKPTFSTDKLTDKQLAAIDVDITGWKSLTLIIGNGGDGTGHDHGAWFEPTLHLADGSTQPLTDLKWKSAKQGWGKTLVNKDCTGKPLKSSNGKEFAFGIGTHSESTIVYKKLPKNAIRFTARGGMASSSPGGSVTFIVHPTPISLVPASKEGPHAIPNPDIILPHVAVKALVNLEAVRGCVEALGGPNERGALWALKSMHSMEAVDGLARTFTEADSKHREALIPTLARLYQQEAPYDGSWWWGTRPDTRGPYYKPAPWEGSDKIEAMLREAWASGVDRGRMSDVLRINRVNLEGIELIASGPKKKEEPKVDLAKVDTSKGEVGNMSVEDVIVKLDGLKGDPKRGEKLFTQQGCVACHTLSADEEPKGPFMGQIGAIMTREQIAMSILRPNETISQGFATFSVQTKDNKAYAGFITRQTADEIELRDIAGKVTVIQTENIQAKSELPISMMPPALANPLSMKDFAALVDFLSSRKK